MSSLWSCCGIRPMNRNGAVSREVPCRSAQILSVCIRLSIDGRATVDHRHTKYRGVPQYMGGPLQVWPALPPASSKAP